MRIIVDRIVEQKAVVELESGSMLTIPVELIGDAKEGDAIVLTTEKKSEETKSDTHSIFERLRNKSKADN